MRSSSLPFETVYTIYTFDWRRRWHPTPVLLPGKSHGWRSLMGCSPCGRKESDVTERLHFHVSLSCIGGGNGNPLQCSCLENPRDGGALWAAVYGVAQSRTRLKRLSSSSSSPRTATATPRGNITKQNDTNINRFLNRHRFCCGLLYPFFFFFLKLTIFSRR